MSEIKRNQEDVIKAFKVFIKVLIFNSACDFKRKYYTEKIETVSFDEFVENKVSLSLFDDDAFFVENYSLDEVMKKIGYKHKITNFERKILTLLQMGYTRNEISRRIGISTKSINMVLVRLRKKLRRDRNDG